MKSIWLILKLLKESSLFAFQAVITNKLRTFLSLMGITIGIFCIISVFTVFDSLESTITNNLNSLGKNVLFIQKWPWGTGGEYPWWKYFQRPEPSLRDLENLHRRSNTSEAIALMTGISRSVKYDRNAIESAEIVGISEDYDKVMTLDLADGRYFTNLEFVSGRNVAIIGDEIVKNLFTGIYPIGQKIKIFGQKLEVVGVMRRSGSGIFGDSKDNQVLVPVEYIRDYIDMDRAGATILVKAKPLVSNEELKDELTGLMRSIHKLKPGADDDFAINEPSLLSQSMAGFFTAIGIVGWIIGGFSLLVGGFGIANIMFVSVKERTSLIGIQKAIGAKNYFILFQFLIESVVLSVMGGILGLIIIFAGTLFVSDIIGFELTLTSSNIVLGVLVSGTIGLVFGFIPAYRASRLNPVDAIRSGQ